jgi:hypothetical protein
VKNCPRLRVISQSAPILYSEWELRSKEDESESETESRRHVGLKRKKIKMVAKMMKTNWKTNSKKMKKTKKIWREVRIAMRTNFKGHLNQLTNPYFCLVFGSILLLLSLARYGSYLSVRF